MAWIDVKEYEALRPDKISMDGGEQYLKVKLMSTFVQRTALRAVILFPEDVFIIRHKAL